MANKNPKYKEQLSIFQDLEQMSEDEIKSEMTKLATTLDTNTINKLDDEQRMIEEYLENYNLKRINTDIISDETKEDIRRMNVYLIIKPELQIAVEMLEKAQEEKRLMLEEAKENYKKAKRLDEIEKELSTLDEYIDAYQEKRIITDRDNEMLEERMVRYEQLKEEKRNLPEKSVAQVRREINILNLYAKRETIIGAKKAIAFMTDRANWDSIELMSAEELRNTSGLQKLMKPEQETQSSMETNEQVKPEAKPEHVSEEDSRSQGPIEKIVSRIKDKVNEFGQPEEVIDAEYETVKKEEEIEKTEENEVQEYKPNIFKRFIGAIKAGMHKLKTTISDFFNKSATEYEESFADAEFTQIDEEKINQDEIIRNIEKMGEYVAEEMNKENNSDFRPARNGNEDQILQRRALIDEMSKLSRNEVLARRDEFRATGLINDNEITLVAQLASNFKERRADFVHEQQKVSTTENENNSNVVDAEYEVVDQHEDAEKGGR